MYQQITLIGNLGTDPEMRFTSNGTPVANFNLAVGKSWTGADGQRQEKTTWFRIACWNKLAELATTYLAKGKKAMIVGEIDKVTPWTDRDGNQQINIEIKADRVVFLSPAGESGGGSNGYSANGSAIPTPQIEDEEIPF